MMMHPCLHALANMRHKYCMHYDGLDTYARYDWTYAVTFTGLVTGNADSNTILVIPEIFASSTK